MAELKREFEYYQTHKEELLQKHLGKFVVIKGQAVLGVFDSALEAIEAMKGKHELGTYLVQHVTPLGDQATFRSRVAS